MPLAESRPAAAFPPFNQVNLETGSFQHSYRGNSNLGLMIANESVIPQKNSPARASRRFAAPLEPLVEPLVCVVRQRALRGYSQSIQHQLAHCVGIQRCICQPGNSTTDVAKSIYGTQQAFAPGH